MESIIKFIEGKAPSDTNKCFFCKKEAPFTFGVIHNENTIYTKDGNNFIMNNVALCNLHAEAFNSLLSGEHDVNDLIQVMATRTQKKINLRR